MSQIAMGSTLLAGAFVLSQSVAQGASIGDPAPRITVERWIKGTPVQPGPGTNIYVVEFWATWCGPCKKSIPHLTELQRKYGPMGVIIVGISDEKPALVSQFVTQQGNSMFYRVGVDTSRRTFNSWMHAYGESGIPHAFVVDREGKVAWHGFPNSGLDRFLEGMVSGKYDSAEAKQLREADQLIAQYKAMVAKPTADEKAAGFAEDILTKHSAEWRVAHRLAKAILTDPGIRSRDLPLALRASNKAVEMTQERSADALEIKARALFANGKKQEAIETQKKAIALSSDQSRTAEMQKFLALYEKGSRAN